MGEIIKISDFNKGHKDGEPKKTGDKTPVSFEESKEIIEMERKYADFEERYKKLAFRQRDPKGQEALKIQATGLIYDIEEFEAQIKHLQIKIMERGRAVEEQFNEAMKEKGFEVAEKEFSTASAREVDRSIKLLDLENKIAALKEQITTLFE
ncbi:hypothetical protein A3I27_01945 [Candidatus Giovannonibacteria bacterium RIFCSPLOWO2_02_FULL_43_11b]|uniref:Uncharacterized protein n=1 Tax=Candidatus Giovannonibacteria bacterium RIFCSPHIGHO2_12_FULL_43_15 TaxID=1798341 RepID=A0A1F5WQY5_9BACT|nr:MAG: hypothetical protein A2739_01945 [Candidatus Giovannonibacteria bacterium RIFCSPHIGHO2_01_FULL_43_100]OGF67837.1 MAG: hypothetical protein A3B97_00975 [Candidatus Giovannonibacteria bacterium RIFCSPHIGHO2_02_FULL_43_32]OGF77997.1 MAG: hypothetical protein A3F23_03330 [Candidatus Giovannonibacteria bacterium RIFCSPHIGHO2_12_FULL_43_15]OGF79518.1 MAG: hypothetical protein A3A15_02195 [Candidatus Giovannonibacteria bacterium RIFCSPLOWO2_01_FULL_43_60]OGF89247.1 MAG: hypothetical protein A3